MFSGTFKSDSQCIEQVKNIVFHSLLLSVLGECSQEKNDGRLIATVMSSKMSGLKSTFS